MVVEFTVGLLVGITLGLLCCRVAYAFGRYQGQVEAILEGANKVNDNAD